MTSTEIKALRDKVDAFVSEGLALAASQNKPANLDLQHPTFLMLAEVAYQTALMNEKIDQLAQGFASRFPKT
jgi:hypothetical protein